MKPIMLICVLLVAAPVPAVAQEHAAAGKSADQLQWTPVPPMLPKGAQAAVLAGDPTKQGAFTLRLKLPAGYKIPAHSHPTAEQVTVLSGEFEFGMGDKLDATKAHKLGSGGFVDLPANMNHFALANTETIIQINSEGPFVIKYADPADDPSRPQ